MKATWSIERLETVPNADGLVDVVRVIHWALTASDGGRELVYRGRVELASPSGAEAFVAYDKLTADQVIAWMKAGLPQPAVAFEEDIARLLAEQTSATPIVLVAKPLPWAPEG